MSDEEDIDDAIQPGYVQRMKTAIKIFLFCSCCCACAPSEAKPKATPKPVVNAQKLCNAKGEQCKKCDAKVHKAEYCKPDAPPMFQVKKP